MQWLREGDGEGGRVQTRQREVTSDRRGYFRQETEERLLQTGEVTSDRRLRRGYFRQRDVTDLSPPSLPPLHSRSLQVED